MARENKRKVSGLTKTILATAKDMRGGGLMDKEGLDKITMRHLAPSARTTKRPPTGKEIRALREKAHLSQAVFAHYLNLTVGYVSQLERGTKRPTGPALVLLDVIRRKGIEAIL
jgi:putative transcriptional regulator